MGVNMGSTHFSDKLEKLEYVISRAYRKIEEKHMIYSELESLKSKR